MQPATPLRFALLILTGGLAYPAFGADFSQLSLFKAGALQKGLWQMQVLESSQPNMQQLLAQAGNVSFCADIATQMGKNAAQETQQNCTTKVISDQPATAEVEMICGENTNRIKLQKENAQNFVSDITTNGSAGTQHFKVRYTYKGECKGDALIQMDKNSPACRAMAGMDMTALCAQSPAEYRAQCEQQAKQTQGMCQ